jgi:class 3 adenylate cyclase/tetratricopeptide (TPR) repeat protein
MDPRGGDRGGDASMDIAQWLHGLGLQQYEQAFRENAIDDAVLPELTADDLKDLGVSLVGHRRKLLAAITALHSESGPAPQAKASDVTDTLIAERRHLTVMFCDLVGSTPLSSRYDPEDLREILGAYHRAVTDRIALYGGFVAKYMGDGVLVYFGYPEAHEDDTERAIRAGLAVIEAVGRLAAPEPLNVRVGIATGLVVVGDLIGVGAAQERGVVGETPNLAARLQALARPGTLVVAESTRRQIGALFELEDLGPQPLAGFADPLRAWRVLGESGILSRFEALRSDATPLVGRDEELDLLQRRWRQAGAGEGQVVLLSGEPGIGKSRLTAVLSQRIEAEPHTRLRYFCSPHQKDIALRPFIGQLERAAGFVRDDTTATKLDKLEALLGDDTEPGDISLIAEMMSLSGGERFPSLDLSAQRKKERTFAALLRQLQALARRPLLMIFEDLHWIDPTSREALDLTVERITALPVLLVATYRPEFQPPWAGQSQVSVITLNRLRHSEGAAMVRRVAGNFGTLPPDVVDEIVERTDGVPLFVEEMTKAVVEAGAGRGHVSVSAVPAVSVAVPATLHASLLERIDRLGRAAKQTAQVGAVIGRDFSYELLAAVAELTESELQDALCRLGEAGLVFQRGTPPAAEYLFKHALVQDTAYSTLLKSRRQQIHSRIATTLEETFSDVVASQPALLARHCTEAGLVEKAIDCWVAAGDSAERRGMTQEAVAHYRAANGLFLPELPVDLRAKQPELLMKLASALLQAQGYRSVEAQECYERARSLAATFSQIENYARAAIGIAPILFSECRYREVLQIISEVSSDSLHRLGPIMRVHLLTEGIIANYGIGQYRTAWEQAKNAYLLDDEVQCTHNNPIGGGDPAIVVRQYAVRVGTALGYFEDCLSLARQSLSTARARNHAFSVAWALQAMTIMHRLLGNYTEAVKLGTEAIEICERSGFRARMGALLPVIGAARFGLGETERGLSEIRRGIQLWRDTGGFHLPSHLGDFADCLLRVGKLDEAEKAIFEGEEIVDRTDEQSHGAEILRMRGMISAMKGDLANGARKLREAIRWSRMRGTKLFELRALRDLTRLMLATNDSWSTKQELRRVVNWFPATLEPPDLAEARELLQA